LVLLIAVCVWLFRNRDLPPDEHLRLATTIAGQTEVTPSQLGEAKLHLERALKQDIKLEKEVEALRDRLRIHELRNELRRGRDKQDITKTSEPNRILKQAQKLSDNHDYAQAERKLRALIAMTEGQTELRDVHSKATQLLNVLLDERTQRTLNWLPTALSRADKLAAEGKRDEATALWKAIIELYAEDPSAAEQVAQARNHLQEMSDKPAANKTTTDALSPPETDSSPKADAQ
jgi:hypothetical protein